MTSPGLDDGDLPGLYEAADKASLLGQKQYLRAARGRLVLGIAAAAMSLHGLAIGSLNATALLAATAFLAALIVEVWLLAEKPERRWYDGRALAESSKTLAWRYAVGAEPFPIDMSGAQQALLVQLNQLLRDAPQTGILPTSRPAVSEAMDKMREESLEMRRSAYLSWRIEDQRQWYGDKSRMNGEMADRWSWILIIIEACGVAAAVGRAVGWYELDATSLFAAMMGAAAAWVGVKQFRSLQRAYAFANQELGIIHTRLSRNMSESEWAAEAADAEEAISREHTMWRASRSTLGVI